MASIRVKCPKCSRELSATPKAAGTLRLRCPSCTSIFTVNVPASKVSVQPVAQPQPPKVIPVIPIANSSANQQAANFQQPIAQPPSAFLDQLNAASYSHANMQGSLGMSYYSKPKSRSSGKLLLVLSGGVGVSAIVIVILIYLVPFVLSMADGDVAYRSQRVDAIENELFQLRKLDTTERGSVSEDWNQLSKKISKSEYDAIVAKYENRLQQYDRLLKKACNIDPSYLPRSNWESQQIFTFTREDLSRATYQFNDPNRLAEKLRFDIHECESAIAQCIMLVRHPTPDSNGEVLQKALSILSNIDS